MRNRSACFLSLITVLGTFCFAAEKKIDGESRLSETAVLYLIPGPYLDSSGSLILSLPIAFYSDLDFYDRSPTYKGGATFHSQESIAEDIQFFLGNSKLVDDSVRKQDVALYLYVMTPNRIEFRFMRPRDVEAFIYKYKRIIGEKNESNLQQASKFSQQRSDGSDLVNSWLIDNYSKEAGYYTVSFSYREFSDRSSDPFSVKATVPKPSLIRGKSGGSGGGE